MAGSSICFFAVYAQNCLVQSFWQEKSHSFRPRIG